MQNLADRELPRSMAYEWTELTYQQILAGNTALFIFPLCVLFVFLTHSAEYESWALPLAIILIVPMSLLCALTGVWLRGMDNNLFTQIGFVVLAGLACKNAVLIVEFAKQQHEHGLAVPRGGRRGLEAPAPPDHDDLVRLHPRRGAADARHGRRGGDAADAGHRRLQRHVGRDLLRHLPHARVLLRLAVAAGPVALSPPPALRAASEAASQRQSPLRPLSQPFPRIRHRPGLMTTITFAVPERNMPLSSFNWALISLS